MRVFHFQCTDLLHHNEQTSTIMSFINSERHKNESSLSDKISTNAPTLYFPKNASFPAQPTSKRLSPSRYSTPLPLPSLSILVFDIHRSTTHAITSIRGYTSEWSSVHFPRRIKSPRFGWDLFIIYSHASIADWLAFGAVSLA